MFKEYKVALLLGGLCLVMLLGGITISAKEKDSIILQQEARLEQLSTELGKVKEIVGGDASTVSDIEKQISTLLKQAEKDKKTIQELTEERKRLQSEVDSLEGVRSSLLESIGYVPSRSEIELLYRIVEAEAGNQSEKCRIAVANVIFNRVKSERFPNTLQEVIKQPYQFSPVGSGRVYRVEVQESTIKAVNKALKGAKAVPSNIYHFFTLGMDLGVRADIKIGKLGFSRKWK